MTSDAPGIDLVRDGDAVHPAYETDHVVRLTEQPRDSVLKHPPSCRTHEDLRDCAVTAAWRRLKPEMSAVGGWWTCEAQDGALILLERIGDS